MLGDIEGDGDPWPSLGLIEAEGDIEGDTDGEIDGEIEALGLIDGETEGLILGDSEDDALIDGEIEWLGLIDEDGEIEAEVDPLHEVSKVPSSQFPAWVQIHLVTPAIGQSG